MNKKILIEWLDEFKEHADKWFKEKTFVNERYEFFNAFFQNIRNDEYKTDEDFFDDYDKMCDNIHSLTTNKLALARAKGKKERHFTREEYIFKFKHFIDTNIEVEKRINKALYNKDYKLNYLGTSSISELISYNEPEKYTFLNQKDKQAIRFLNIKIKNKKFGNYFAEYNKIVKKEILPEYIAIIYPDELKNIKQKEKVEKLFNFGNTKIIPQGDLKTETTLMLEIDQFFSWIFQTKKLGEIDSCFINEIAINNFYSIKNEIEFNDLKNKKFIFFLGENGSGKTILLKALLITLKKIYIETETTKKETGIISDILNENKEFLLEATGFKDINQEDIDEFSSTSTIYLKNIYAYGTNRNKVSADKADKYGFMTLFEKNEYLINTKTWLQDIRFKELENKDIKKNTKYIKIKDIETILKQLLEIPNLKLNVNSEKVSFTIEKKEFSITQLSEGYQSIITLIIDLLARLIENNSNTDFKKFKAIVLIDELDLFLHPTWSKNICEKLHEWFPNIQFFITTHSPILIDGASKSKKLIDKMVVYRLENENGQTKITNKYTGEQIKTWSPNILINSDLFDSKYIDELPLEIILNLRTEDSILKMIENNQNIETLREKEDEIVRRYQEILKNEK